MLNQEDANKIRQQKLNALVAIQLHRQKVRNLQRKNRIVESLSVAVPAFYLTPRFLAKGTLFANFIDIAGEILAASLLALAILKLVNKWQDDEINHAIMSQRNRDTDYEADRLLQSQTANSEAVAQFLRRVNDINAGDEALLLSVKEGNRQKAYREALKQYSSTTSAHCPVCGADPWKFIPGSCEACGGTSVK